LSESVPTMTYDATKEMNEIFHPTSKRDQVLSNEVMDRLVPLLEQHQQTDVPPSTFKQRVSVDTGDTDILASLFNSERLSLPPMPLQSQIPLTQLI
ncbi:unnamed protein product, partial [Didymodactylos carnosus]